MKQHVLAVASTVLLATTVFASDAALPTAGTVSNKSQTITRAGANPASKGPAEYFTGNVLASLLFPANPSTPISGHHVSFEPGARSAWHTHPAGQHQIVTAGTGWTQEWGGPITELRKGDVLWCPPGVKHWHGATPTTAMTHIALTGMLNGKNVE